MCVRSLAAPHCTLAAGGDTDLWSPQVYGPWNKAALITHQAAAPRKRQGVLMVLSTNKPCTYHIFWYLCDNISLAHIKQLNLHEEFCLSINTTSNNGVEQLYGLPSLSCPSLHSRLGGLTTTLQWAVGSVIYSRKLTYLVIIAPLNQGTAIE